MSKQILQSSRVLEIGKRYQGLHDPWFVIRPDQAFLVVAQSTREEWIECIIGYGEERAWAEIYADLDPYFYEILTD